VEAHAFQVSRLFSALLQLANDGNVALLRGAAPGDPFALRLLRRAQPSLAGFRAPSCLQAQARALSHSSPDHSSPTSARAAACRPVTPVTPDACACDAARTLSRQTHATCHASLDQASSCDRPNPTRAAGVLLHVVWSMHALFEGDCDCGLCRT